jgi:hypothetical protein
MTITYTKCSQNIKNDHKIGPMSIKHKTTPSIGRPPKIYPTLYTWFEKSGNPVLQPQAALGSSTMAFLALNMRLKLTKMLPFEHAISCEKNNHSIDFLKKRSHKWL